ncbi:MAG: hypothetical protein RLZZ04_3418, partial [Cyanobacteriota bacterium]
MKLATILQSNELSMSKIMNFRSTNSLDISKPHNENFHQHKNQYSYFGFIQIEIENCSPFVMFSCNDDIVAMTYYWYGSDAYERKSISEWVSRSIDSEVILDVGSFTGLYSLAAISSKKSLENVKVYAFEPTRRVHARLLMNIQTNKLRNVIEPVNLAVSNCVEQVRFLQYRGDYILGTGASFIDKGIETTSEEEIVNTISIDEFIEQKKIKPQLIKTLGNKASSPVTPFSEQRSVLFNGKVAVSNGLFNCSFILPKDIRFAPGFGSISLYAFNGISDAAGSTSIGISGFAAAVPSDSKGPDIRLFLNDTLFMNGGLSNESPVLIAQLSDSSGINATGNSIGHDITLVIDGASNNQLVLNNAFSYRTNSYQSGELQFQLPVLSPGKHSLKLKAWDVLNN